MCRRCRKEEWKFGLINIKHRLIFPKQPATSRAPKIVNMNNSHISAVLLRPGKHCGGRTNPMLKSCPVVIGRPCLGNRASQGHDVGGLGTFHMPLQLPDRCRHHTTPRTLPCFARQTVSRTRRRELGPQYCLFVDGDHQPSIPFLQILGFPVASPHPPSTSSPSPSSTSLLLHQHPHRIAAAAAFSAPSASTNCRVLNTTITTRIRSRELALQRPRMGRRV